MVATNTSSLMSLSYPLKNSRGLVTALNRLDYFAGSLIWRSQWQIYRLLAMLLRILNCGKV